MAQELSKEGLLDKIEETAHNYERDYHGCSRCEFRAIQEHLDLGDGSAFLASTPLAGGIAFQGDTCGATPLKPPKALSLGRFSTLSSALA